MRQRFILASTRTLAFHGKRRKKCISVTGVQGGRGEGGKGSKIKERGEKG